MEVRPVAQDDGRHRGLGLFALQDFKAGDFIINDESPLIRLAPSSFAEEEELLRKLTGTTRSTATTKEAKHTTNAKQACSSRVRLWDSIVVPGAVAKNHVGKFKGMVQAALCIWNHLDLQEEEYLLQDEQDKKSKLEELLQLYHPNEDSNVGAEQEILRLAELAIEHLDGMIKSTPPPTAKTQQPQQQQQQRSKMDERRRQILKKVALIWSCNSFEGGRMYKTISRINHSCNPNAMIQTDDNDSSSSSDNNNSTTSGNQSVRAVTSIRAGEEITISYLGLFLYAERPVRQKILKDTKHFDCDCPRCQQEEKHPEKDSSSYVPCPQLHLREQNGRQLDEETQYDDDATVSYICGWSVDSANWIGEGRTQGDDKNNHHHNNNNKMASQSGDKERLVNAMQQVRDKTVSFLQDKQHASKGRVADRDGKSGGMKGQNEEDSEDDDALQTELLDQHLRLASSIMGAKHWTTNLLLLFQLDDLLQSIHSNLLLHSETPDMLTLAEAIDMLQRLVRFVDGFTDVLSMDHKKGHLLSDVMIGTARALVSLSDVKSQRYAAEWVNHIHEYVHLFESPGMQKVVDTIATAHKMHKKMKHDGSKRKPASVEQSQTKRTKQK